MAGVIDVAKRAQVSVGTVSNVFNNLDKVRPETRDRVLAAAAELDFRPNLHARALRRGHTTLIGVIVTDIEFPSLANLVRAIQEELTANGCIGVSVNTDGDQTKTRAALEDLRAQGFGGFILSPIPGWYDDETKAMLLRLHSEGVPLALVANDMAGFPTDVLEPHAEAGSRHMVNYLAEKGHEKIAYVGMQIDDVTAGRGRWLGFQEGMFDNGLPLRPEYRVEMPTALHQFAAGAQALDKLMSLDDPPTAIMAVSDSVAHGLISTCHQRGIEVPDDVSVAGFNDEPVAKYFAPPLTTIRFATGEIGRQAAQFIVERLSDPHIPPRKPDYPIELIERESVGQPRSS